MRMTMMKKTQKKWTPIRLNIGIEMIVKKSNELYHTIFLLSKLERFSSLF